MHVFPSLAISRSGNPYSLGINCLIVLGNHKIEKKTHWFHSDRWRYKKIGCCLGVRGESIPGHGLAWARQQLSNLEVACEKSLSTMCHILQKTVKWAKY